MRKARVFISCGQRPNEKDVGLEIVEYFRNRGFDPYFAEEIQTPEALTQNIFNSLRASEYFICINFEREPGTIGSLFIQEEFSIAAFQNIPMLSFHKGNINAEGIAKYLILKSIPFKTVNEIKNKLDKLTKDWNPNSLHQLELECGNFHPDMRTQDGYITDWIHIVVHNRSKVFYCKNCYAFIETIINVDTNTTVVGSNEYKTELIWAGTGDISVNIPQDGKKDVDALFWIHDSNQILFHQRTSSTSYGYQPLPFGKYKIIYGIISDNFPVAKIMIEVQLTRTGVAVLSWEQEIEP